MSPTRVSAHANARWRTPSDVVLDHVTLTPDDAEWLAPARSITAWAVKARPGLYAALPVLERLDVRGGSGTDLSFLDGCARLQALTINQVRGVNDLTHVAALSSVEWLSIYGLPQVTASPSFAEMAALRVLRLGSMKGLEGLSGLLDAPALTHLHLARMMGLDISDADRINDHPSLTHFAWYAEDVPDRVWVPFCERVRKNPFPDSALTVEGWLDSIDR